MRSHGAALEVAQRGDTVDSSQPGCRCPGSQQGVPQHGAVMVPWARALVRHRVAGEAGAEAWRESCRPP